MSASPARGSAMSESHFWIARSAAARAAVIVAENNDRETAHDTTKGLLTGFLLAFVKYDEWDQTLAYINQLAIASRVPAEVEKPKLSVIQGGKSHESVSVV